MLMPHDLAFDRHAVADVAAGRDLHVEEAQRQQHDLDGQLLAGVGCPDPSMTTSGRSQRNQSVSHWSGSSSMR
jgi:hypothetical protein